MNMISPPNAAQQLLDFVAANEQLNYLKCRWLDEREYEDFAEYKTAIAKIFVDAGYTVGKITKSFAIDVISVAGKRMRVTIGASKVRVETLRDAAKPSTLSDRLNSKYWVELADRSGMKMHPCNTFAECSAAVLEFIADRNLGAGCSENSNAFIGGMIVDVAARKPIGRVSYNGHVWDLENKEIAI